MTGDGRRERPWRGMGGVEGRRIHGGNGGGGGGKDYGGEWSVEDNGGEWKGIEGLEGNGVGWGWEKPCRGMGELVVEGTMEGNAERWDVEGSVQESGGILWYAWKD